MHSSNTRAKLWRLAVAWARLYLISRKLSIRKNILVLKAVCGLWRLRRAPGLLEPSCHSLQIDARVCTAVAKIIPARCHLVLPKVTSSSIYPLNTDTVHILNLTGAVPHNILFYKVGGKGSIGAKERLTFRDKITLI